MTFLNFLLYTILQRAASWDRISSTTGRVVVTTLVFFNGLPAALVVLATSGGYSSVLIQQGSQDIWGVLETLCAVGITLLIIVVPEYMRLRSQSPAANDSPVPTWLAGFATVLTAAFILMLHFGDGILHGPHVGAI